MFSLRTTRFRQGYAVAVGRERIARWGIGLLFWTAVLNWGAMAVAVEPEPIMASDPKLFQAPRERRFPRGLAELLIRALDSQERELRRLAASDIVQAHRRGLTGLEAAIEPLMKVILRLPAEERLTRLAMVRALVELDAKQSAALLQEQLQPDDREMAELVEPALARWGQEAMREVWLKRLQGDASPRLHILAIRGLASLQEKSALPRMLELVLDSLTPAEVRLAAAATLGQLQETGLLQAAAQLSSDTTPRGVASRLAAAQMLDSHRGAETEQLLARLAVDPQTVVRSVSLAQLFRRDPELIMPVLDATLASDDVNVRRWGAKALIAKPDAGRVTQLATLLSDPDPDLRVFVCDALVTLAEQESLRETILTEGRRALARDEWRGQEQAILLLVTLDDKSIVDRLLTLLAATRPEVHVTAAWGLSRLEVPATLERMLAVFTQTTESFQSGSERRDRVHEQLSHLAQALGRMQYRPADAILRRYMPKNAPFAPVSRAAAIWALGWIHADALDKELADRMLERLLDVYAFIPEAEIVGRMSAISLGRMKAEHTVEGLRSAHSREGLTTALGYATAWSTHQITGEAIGELPPIPDYQDNWALTPNAGE